MQFQTRHTLIATPEGIFMDGKPLNKCDLSGLTLRQRSHLASANALWGRMTVKDWEPPKPHRIDDVPVLALIKMHFALFNPGILNKFDTAEPRDEKGRWTSGSVAAPTPPSASTESGFIPVKFPGGSRSGGKAGNYPSMLAPRTDGGKVDIDWSFISRQEGGQKTEGYVPKVKTQEGDKENKNKSGVTIATGVDLGAHSASGIDQLKISPELKAKLKPYCGKQGKDAKDYLEKHPLTITKDEATALDKEIRQQIVHPLVARYNNSIDAANERDQGHRIHFEMLPQAVQTVIASVSFQYGWLPKSCRDFWGLVTEQRWKDASDNLKNFKDDYATRRMSEAALIDEAIKEAPGAHDELRI